MISVPPRPHGHEGIDTVTRRKTAHMDVEYLIVGAGAAGCTLGWLLQQARRSVLVLERRDTQKKDKLCGGILGVTSLAMLESTFGECALEELAPTQPARKINRCLNKEAVSRCAYAAISRKRLDDWLLARYVTADGANSTVR